MSSSRQYLRGWSANKSVVSKKEKADILSRLEELDKKGEDNTILFPESLWMERYHLEAKLDQIYYKEEIYWQQRGSEKWLLQGDANTHFFMLVQTPGRGKPESALWEQKMVLYRPRRRLLGI
jgi:hypothetical protein